MQFPATMIVAEYVHVSIDRIIPRKRDLSTLIAHDLYFSYICISRLRDLIISTNITCPLSAISKARVYVFTT